MKTKIYDVWVESKAMKVFSIRAGSRKEAKNIASNLAEAINFPVSSMAVTAEQKDNGQNVDNYGPDQE